MGETTVSTINIDDLIETLSTEEGQTAAAMQAFESGRDINKKHAQFVINRLIKEGEIRKAAELAERIGDAKQADALHEKTLRLYELNADAEKATELALKRGEVLRAIGYHVRKRDFPQAARIALKHNYVDLAIAYYERARGAHHDFVLRAANMARRRKNDIPLAIEILGRGGEHSAAALLAEKIGDWKRASYHLERARRYADAGDLLIKNGQVEEANRLYGKQFEEYECEGRLDLAATLAERIGKSEKAATYKSLEQALKASNSTQ